MTIIETLQTILDLSQGIHFLWQLRHARRDRLNALEQRQQGI